MKDVSINIRLIAEFMGWKYIDDGDIFYKSPELLFSHELEYHSSWDWLHNPYNKFFSLTEFDTVTDGKFHNRNPYFVQQLQELKSAWSSLNIKLAFEQIVAAIKWYNQNK